MPSKHDREVVAVLLRDYGQTYAEEMKIALERNTPSPLFKMLCATVLFSHPIGSEIAVKAARALFSQGWTTAPKMADTTWRQRTNVLNRAGFARYDESTSRRIGEMTERVLDKYNGDLRNLRAEADRKADEERRLLQQFKGVGATGADIFAREVQVAWPELGPFVDRRAAKAAKRLGLPTDAKALGKLTSKADFVHLVAALVRVELDDNYDDVKALSA